ncbi:hypothetical protein L1887_55527 [Cichorium endivia]|nr:hypothetical protein L1887_55527 [Cichorium endivia]
MRSRWRRVRERELLILALVVWRVWCGECINLTAAVDCLFCCLHLVAGRGVWASRRPGTRVLQLSRGRKMRKKEDGVPSRGEFVASALSEGVVHALRYRQQHHRVAILPRARLLIKLSLGLRRELESHGAQDKPDARKSPSSTAGQHGVRTVGLMGKPSKTASCRRSKSAAPAVKERAIEVGAGKRQERALCSQRQFLK